MLQDRYDLIVARYYTRFEFISIGPRGNIHKIVEFQQTDIPILYNLAFGDRNVNENDFDDKAVTNNGDTGKVLATIGFAVEIFTEQHQEVWVYATGSTISRNRLYQMSINKYFDLIADSFEVIGETEGDWEPFKKSRNYKAFAIRRKI